MEFILLVAMSDNEVIGVNNRLPWHLPADLAYFKNTTKGGVVLMGRLTYESIGKPLPHRENWVLSRDTSFHPEGVLVFHSVEEMVQYAERTQKEKIFIIGGDQIYKLLLPIANQLMITRVHTHVEQGDAFFSMPDPVQWDLSSSLEHEADEKNAFSMTFQVYKRRANS